jgi:putative component of toxin-antitoxin plasmid stabilization module
VIELKQTDTFLKWRARLKDERTRGLTGWLLDMWEMRNRWDKGSANFESTMAPAIASTFDGEDK